MYEYICCILMSLLFCALRTRTNLKSILSPPSQVYTKWNTFTNSRHTYYNIIVVFLPCLRNDNDNSNIIQFFVLFWCTYIKTKLYRNIHIECIVTSECNGQLTPIMITGISATSIAVFVLSLCRSFVVLSSTLNAQTI